MQSGRSREVTKIDNEYMYDIGGWVILGVLAVGWIILARQNMQ